MPNDARCREQWPPRALVLRAGAACSQLEHYRWHLCEGAPRRASCDGHLLASAAPQRYGERAARRPGRASCSASRSARRRLGIAPHLEFLAEASLLTRSLDTQGILGGLAALVTPRLCTWCVVDVLEAGGLVQATFATRTKSVRARRRLAERLSLGWTPLTASPACSPASSQTSARPPDPRLAAALGTAPTWWPSSARSTIGAPTWPRPVSTRPALVSAEELRSPGPRHRLRRRAWPTRRARNVEQRSPTPAPARRAARDGSSPSPLRAAAPSRAGAPGAERLQVASAEAVDLARINDKATVMDAGSRAYYLINEMLDVSRIEAGPAGAGSRTRSISTAGAGAEIRLFAAELEQEEAPSGSCCEGVVSHWDRLRLSRGRCQPAQNAIKYGRGRAHHGAPARRGAPAPPMRPCSSSARTTASALSPADQRRIFKAAGARSALRHYRRDGRRLFLRGSGSCRPRGRIEFTGDPDRARRSGVAALGTAFAPATRAAPPAAGTQHDQPGSRRPQGGGECGPLEQALRPWRQLICLLRW